MKQRLMMLFLALLICLTFTVPAVNVAAATTITRNQTGYDGLWYSFWTNGIGSVAMTLNGGGNYSVTFSNCGDFTCGKGWNPGSGHTISYSGTYNNSGGGAFGIYGWTTNPLIEYYIVEKTGNGGGPQGTLVGSVVSDGDTYDIYKHQQVNQPSIQGNNSTFWQYISIRRSQRTSGTITIQNHFNAWRNIGLNLGTMNYQVFLTEAWNGSGSASATVSEGTTTPTPSPTSTPVGPTTVQCESMSRGGQYAGLISSPFSGVALYANNDYCKYTQYFSNGTHSFSLRGCSNNSNQAKVDLRIGGQYKGTFYYGGSNPAVYTLNNISHGTGNQEVQLIVTTDNGTWDAFLDYLTIQ